MKKLYEHDSYLREYTTRVTAYRSTEKGIHQIQLEESIFFPEGGGQYADHGTLVTADGRNISLTDGQEKQGEIWYTVSEKIDAGTEVTGILDWETRFDRLQQHTGEHVLTGMIHNTYGFDNVGFHLSDDAPVTLDMNGELSYEQVMEMETKANAIIFSNVPVHVTYPDKEELETLNYRSKIDIEGQVRIVTIGDPSDPIDVCACCAPHLSLTGEVGLIKVISIQRYKGGVRIGILCGRRAMEHYDREWHRLDTIARALSTGPENILNTIEAQRQEIYDLKHQLAAGAENRLLQQIKELPDHKNLYIFAEENLEPNTFKNGFNALASRTNGYVGIFMGDDTSGYRYYAGSTELDSRELAATMRTELNAKGGGSKEMIQGKVMATKEQIQSFFHDL